MKKKQLIFAHDASGQGVGIQAEDAHTLLVGQPSSGKSKAMDAIILEVLKEPQNIAIVVDPKRTGFQVWKENNRVRVYQHMQDFSNVFEALFQEHERRTSVLQCRGLESMPSDMQRVYVVVDELPSLVAPDSAIISSAAVKSISQNMLQLLRLSRQTGIQLICASQSAEGKNLISANARGLYANRILMRSSNANEAEMTLNASADDLRLDTMLPGEAWIRSGHLDAVKCWVDYYPNDALRKSVVDLPTSNPDFSFMEKRGL